MKASSPSLKYESTSNSFRSEATTSSALSLDQRERDFIAFKKQTDGITSSPSISLSSSQNGSSELGGMFQLESLTAAATAVEKKSNESNVRVVLFFINYSLYYYLISW